MSEPEDAPPLVAFLTLVLNTKSVNVLGIAENVTDAADEDNVLDAISVYVFAIMRPLFRRVWRLCQRSMFELLK